MFTVFAVKEEALPVAVDTSAAIVGFQPAFQYIGESRAYGHV